MCGICGEIRWDGHTADVGAVTRMTGAMTSRGPDADAWWLTDRWRWDIGACRSSTCPLAVRSRWSTVISG